jgi:hypothetical protein
MIKRMRHEAHIGKEQREDNQGDGEDSGSPTSIGEDPASPEATPDS